MSRPDEVQAVRAVAPCRLAVECAESLTEYCLTRFPCATPPHRLIDVPWFAERVQRCIDEAAAEGPRLKKALEAAEARIDAALALTDTGSAEFKAHFPPKTMRESVAPRDLVPGWRVVEKVREALLAGGQGTGGEPCA